MNGGSRRHSLPWATAGAFSGYHHQLLLLTATVVVWVVFDSAYHIGDFRPLDGSDGFRYALPIAALLAPLVAAGSIGFVSLKLVRVVFVLVLFSAVFATSLLTRPFLQSVGRVAQMEPMANEKLSRRTWTDADVLITRSVAFAHAKTNAPNVFERCSINQIDAATSRDGSVTWYLRSWGDGGATKLERTCPHAASAVPDSPDGLGQWLFEYGICVPKPVRPSPP